MHVPVDAHIVERRRNQHQPRREMNGRGSPGLPVAGTQRLAESSNQCTVTRDGFVRGLESRHQLGRMHYATHRFHPVSNTDDGRRDPIDHRPSTRPRTNTPVVGFQQQ